MKYHILPAGIVLLMLLLIPVSAFDIREGDTIVINDPVSDDLMVSGGTVTINAPVKSLTFAGGKLEVNAPVDENLIAAGGEISVNAPVGTDLIAAGGRVVIDADVGGKVLAVGGQAVMNGQTSNIAISGGKVLLGKASHITGDALIGSSDYVAEGKIDGEVRTDTDDETIPDQTDALLSGIITILSILFSIGMLIAGIIMIRLIPHSWKTVTSDLQESAVMAVIIGIAGIIATGVLVILLMMTIIGIPIALISGLIFLIGLIISTLVTGAAIGSCIAEKAGRELSPTISFMIGFIILEILCFIPILGILIKMIAICAGFGALLMATRTAVISQAASP